MVEKCADGKLLGQIPTCTVCGGGRLRFDYHTVNMLIFRGFTLVRAIWKIRILLIAIKNFNLVKSRERNGLNDLFMEMLCSLRLNLWIA